MYNAQNVVIYVGKAKNLKNRLSSYFRQNVNSEKTKVLVRHIDHIDVTVTHTETEALILEHNYIKKYRPKYNVLLRDDKSYPYILLTDHAFPRLRTHRGAKRQKGTYFGPYPNSSAVKESLHLLQKIFPIRQCEDSVFANRTRPCLMHQIGRCLAPCVKGFVTDEEYQTQATWVRLFLQGKDTQVTHQLVEKMNIASANWQFELAAKYRDQIQVLRKVQEQQFVSSAKETDLDVLGLAEKNGLICIYALFIRQGKILGSRSYFPSLPKMWEWTASSVMASFVSQFYLNQDIAGRIIPFDILLSEPLEEDNNVLAQALSEVAKHQVHLHSRVRGERQKYVSLAITNAQTALQDKLQQKQTTADRFLALKKTLGLSNIQRMECFDISHTMGERTVASCVVFSEEGPNISEYRRFNIEGITGGDDYAAMAQVLTLRYQKLTEENRIPDVIFIDGGDGQLNRAVKILTPIMASWPRLSQLVGVAKGTSRKPGLETLILPTGEHFSLPSDSSALHLIQHIRDESHRYAITGHRARRNKARTTSVLEEIEGIGPKRRQALLQYMGGLQGLKCATQEEIAKVPGISLGLALKIFDALQES
jgi:excinuclease ABC subunit C